MSHMTTEATSTQISDSLAARLYRARKTARLTRQDLAAVVGVHQNTVARWEDVTTSAAPGATEIAALAAALNVDASWLAGFAPSGVDGAA